MAIVSQIWDSSLFHPGIDKMFNQYNAVTTQFWRKLYPQTLPCTDRAYLKVVLKTDMDLPAQINPAERIPEVSNDISYRQEITPLRYAAAYKYDQYAEQLQWQDTEFLNKVGQDLAGIHARLKDIVAYNTLNLSFSSQKTADGLAWVANNHKLASGTTSNLGVYNGSSYINVAFGALAIEDAIASYAAQKSHKGLPTVRTGPYRLFGGTKLWGIMKRVVNAKGLATTNNNDPNVAGGMIDDVVNVPYITSSSAWWLMATNPLPSTTCHAYIPQIPFNSLAYIEEASRVKAFNTVEAFAFGTIDWRDMWGSAGTGA